MNDQSFDEGSLYAGRQWVAQKLGIAPKTFDAKREALEEQGFPRRDALIGLYLKADVLAWISRRSQIGDKVGAQPNRNEVSFNENEL